MILGPFPKVAVALHGWGAGNEPVPCDVLCHHGESSIGYRFAQVIAIDPGLDPVVEYDDTGEWATVPLDLIRGAWIIGS